MNRDVEALLKQQGIELHKSPAYTHQFNGVAERFNRMIVVMVQTMLIDSNLSRGFWAKAFQLAVNIYNAGLADSSLDTTLDGVDRTINAGQADSDSEEDSATSTGGGSFSLGEQCNDSDEEEPGVNLGHCIPHQV